MAYSEKRKQEILDFICDEIAEGKSLRSILSTNYDMPAKKTFFEWMKLDKTKSDQYARAMELRQENIFEDILSIADNQEDDVLLNNDGDEIINHNVIQRARLRVDARKWMLGKMNPKKYGDKLETDNKHSGTIEIVRTIKK